MFSTIQVSDNEILFNMVNILNKDYQWIVSPNIIQDLIYKHYNNGRTLIFNFNDGENFYFSGAAEFIKEIQRLFDIPKEKLIVRSYALLEVPYATCQTYALSPFIFFAMRSIMPIDNSNFNKKFLSLHGRTDVFRLKIAKYLHTNYVDDSIISFLGDAEAVENCFEHMPEEYQDEINWAKKYTPLHVDDLRGNNNGSAPSWEPVLEYGKEYYKDYFIDVTAETEIRNKTWLTEKTFRPMAFGKPFILFGSYNGLAYLRELGFKTFDRWFDESYDYVENHNERLEMVLDEVDRLAALSYDQLKTMATDMYETLVHNQKQLTYLYEHAAEIQTKTGWLPE